MFVWTVGILGRGGEGTSTLVVVGGKGGGLSWLVWTWAQTDSVGPWSDMEPGEQKRGIQGVEYKHV